MTANASCILQTHRGRRRRKQSPTQPTSRPEEPGLELGGVVAALGRVFALRVSLLRLRLGLRRGLRRGLDMVFAIEVNTSVARIE